MNCSGVDMINWKYKTLLIWMILTAPEFWWVLSCNFGRWTALAWGGEGEESGFDSNATQPCQNHPHLLKIFLWWKYTTWLYLVDFSDSSPPSISPSRIGDGLVCGRQKAKMRGTKVPVIKTYCKPGGVFLSAIHCIMNLERNNNEKQRVHSFIKPQTQ